MKKDTKTANARQDGDCTGSRSIQALFDRKSKEADTLVNFTNTSRSVVDCA
ncbi:hypothetical protein GGR88_000578 [Sphingomonas jejuensis]|uniref:Uncharacterized protein n=1 Tax=Sphingomonas jejuensis TaxID=904715 RepID=A0ABX0XIE9_9SPHN|nr:hypothetical protein [Sphingomonas jejuensis]NJC33104.1 hypothetical protein [Sphingomonas jejuensis]